MRNRLRPPSPTNSHLSYASPSPQICTAAAPHLHHGAVVAVCILVLLHGHVTERPLAHFGDGRVGACPLRPPARVELRRGGRLGG